MSYFFKNGSEWHIADERAIDIHQKLPPGNYIAQFHPQKGFYLIETDSFPIPSKIYGDVEKVAARILSTYWERSSSTGVLLAGEKGSGKTLLAKYLSVKGIKVGIPTVTVNTPLAGDGFNKFLQDINQPCIVLFDEFEKTYDKNTQPMILTLLDGVYPSKKLFLLTVNDKWRVDEHMRNRPGRLYYMLDYAGLDLNFIREYAQVNLVDKTQVDAIMHVVTFFERFNFDMLKALIEEMNRYNEPPKESLKYLNVSPLYAGSMRQSFRYTTIKEGMDVDAYSDPVDREFSFNPLVDKFHAYVKDKFVPPTEEEIAEGYTDGEWENKNLRLEPKHMIRSDRNAGVYVYFRDGYTVTVERVTDRDAESFYDML